MNRETLKEIFISALTRHATQAVGGVLVGTGIGNESQAQIVVGLALNAAAYGWSAWRKARRARKAARG